MQPVQIDVMAGAAAGLLLLLLVLLVPVEVGLPLAV
jgi:hypothetical protein